MSAKLQVQTVNVDCPDLDWAKIERWIISVARSHGNRVGELCYVFCDDEKILDVNRRFLNHDYFTDIITFDYTHSRRISGEFYISLDTVRSNAEMLGVSYDRELLRVVIHGVLHLVGINDKGPGEREIMEQHENDALTIYNSTI